MKRRQENPKTIILAVSVWFIFFCLMSYSAYKRIVENSSEILIFDVHKTKELLDAFN